MIPGVMFGEKHSFRDYNLILKSKKISSPELKTKFVNVPAMNGYLDLSDVVTGGIVKYNERTIDMTFHANFGVFDLDQEITIIQEELLSTKIKIIFDTDSEFFWYGRMTSIEASVQNHSIVVIKMKAKVEPYKYSITSSLDDWLWDPFDFETGIINELRDLPVNGNLVVGVAGITAPTNPVVISDAPMQVRFNGEMYDVVEGRQTLFDIVLTSDKDEMEFIGNGVISIDFTGGRL